jgi:hypothetical protein
MASRWPGLYQLNYFQYLEMFSGGMDGVGTAPAKGETIQAFRQGLGPIPSLVIDPSFHVRSTEIS